MADPWSPAGAPGSRAGGTDGSFAAERIAEIGEILAAGLMRLRARKSRELSAETGESSLHFMPGESGHAPVLSHEVGE